MINKKGFTLIELLVTMGIIGILASVTFFGLRGAQEAGRDAKRKSDLENISVALEFYYSDCGSYPPPSNNKVPSPLSSTCTGTTIVYLQEVPTPPRNSERYSYGRPVGNNQTYGLCTILEGGGEGTLPSACPTSCLAGNCNYGVRSL